MPSSANIYGLIQPQPEIAYIPADERQMRQMKLRALMGAEEMQGLQLGETRRGIEVGRSIQDLISNRPDLTGDALINEVAKKDWKRAQEMRKEKLGEDKTRAETGNLNSQALERSLKIHYDQLRGVNDPKMAEQWIMGGFNDPALSPVLQKFGSPAELIGRIPQDPAAFKEWVNKQGMGIEKYAADLRAQQGQAITVRGQDLTDARTRAEGAANRGVTIRGQDMTDSRTREAQEAGRWTNDLDRGLQINSATGETRPITAGGAQIAPKEKPLTEAQGRGQMFGTRAAEADKILTELEKSGTKTPGLIKQAVEGVPIVGGSAGFVMNQMPTYLGGPNASQQKVEQAQRNFVNAVLRQESGAVISPSEFENAQKQYFPQPGDDNKVIEQKRANRQSAVEGFRIMAGPSGPRINAARTPPAPTQAEIEAELRRRKVID